MDISTNHNASVYLDSYSNESAINKQTTRKFKKLIRCLMIHELGIISNFGGIMVIILKSPKY